MLLGETLQIPNKLLIHLILLHPSRCLQNTFRNLVHQLGNIKTLFLVFLHILDED